MALDAFLFYVDALGIKGEPSGINEFCGVDVTDASAINHFLHSIESPRDRASGQATGRRFHTPLRVLKSIDNASPLLLKALVENQLLPKLELKMFRNSYTDGLGTHFYTITLENANVVKVDTELPDTRVEATALLPQREWVEFSYRKIMWTFVEGAIEASDDWQAGAT